MKREGKTREGGGGAGNLGASFITSGTFPAARLSDVLGSWDATKVKDTSYLAATDLIVQVTVTAAGNAIIYTDASNPPTTERAYVGNAITTQGTCSLFSAVKKGDYWKATAGGTPTINIIPIGA